MFFDLSPLELLVLGVMAVVLFGPDRLPQAARSAARVVRHIRALQAQAARTLDPRALLDNEVLEELRQSRTLIETTLDPGLEKDRDIAGKPYQHTYASGDVS